MEFESPTNDEPQNFLLRNELIFHFHFLIYSFIYLPFLIRSTFVRALLQGVSNWEHKIECVYTLNSFKPHHLYSFIYSVVM